MAINRTGAQELISKIPQKLRNAARAERKAFINAPHIQGNTTEIAQKQAYHPMPKNKELNAQIEQLTAYNAHQNYMKTVDTSAPTVATGGFFG